MAIKYNEKTKSFRLDTKAASYVIGIADAEGFVGHAYFGRRLEDDDVTYLMRAGEHPFTPERNARDRLSFLDCFPMEYLPAVWGISVKVLLWCEVTVGTGRCSLPWRTTAFIREN